MARQFLYWLGFGERVKNPKIKIPTILPSPPSPWVEYPLFVTIININFHWGHKKILSSIQVLQFKNVSLQQISAVKIFLLGIGWTYLDFILPIWSTASISTICIIYTICTIGRVRVLLYTFGWRFPFPLIQLFTLLDESTSRFYFTHLVGGFHFQVADISLSFFADRNP